MAAGLDTFRRIMKLKINRESTLGLPDFRDNGGDNPARDVKGSEAVVWLTLENIALGGRFVVWFVAGGPGGTS